MKKINLFLFAALLPCMGSLFGQWGINAGPVFSSTEIKYSSFSMEFESRVGFTGGIAHRRALGATTALQGELNYTQKGGKLSEDGDESELILNYLELPVYFLYTPGGSSGFFAGAGPSFNFGLSGKGKGSSDGDSYEEDVNFGSDEDDDLKGFHMAINVQAGYLLKGGLNFNAFISQSFTNSAIDGEDDEKINMFNFGVRVGYFFHNGGTPAAVKLKQPL